MSSMGTGEIVQIGGRFNSQNCLDILRDTGIYFVQDNCVIHRANVVVSNKLGI